MSANFPCGTLSRIRIVIFTILDAQQFEPGGIAMTDSTTHLPNPLTVQTIVVGSDHAGFVLKQALIQHLQGLRIPVIDVGCHSLDSVDYPDIAGQLAHTVADLTAGTPSESIRGVLVCGSGVGICIGANRFSWIRACVMHDLQTALCSRRHNDTNVACFGERVIAAERAIEILDAWLLEPFDGGRHQDRIDQLTALSMPLALEKTTSAYALSGSAITDVL